MPSGIVHAKTTFFLALPCAALAYGASATLSPREAYINAVVAAAGCLAGIALTPDLDQEGLSTSEYWLIKWTLGLGFLWTMLWYPYARLCKHRSPISHWPLLGTAGRLAYLGLFVAIARALGWQPPLVPFIPAACALTGLLISDSAHWLLDWKFGDSPRRRR